MTKSAVSSIFGTLCHTAKSKFILGIGYLLLQIMYFRQTLCMKYYHPRSRAIFFKKKMRPRLTHYWIHAKYHCEDIKFSVKDFFGKSDQFGKSFLRIWSHLLKKFSMETFIFWCSLSVVSCDHLLFTPAKSISQFVIKVSVKHS